MTQRPITNARRSPHLPSHQEMLIRLSRRPANAEAPRPDAALVPPAERPRPPVQSSERAVVERSLEIFVLTTAERDRYKAQAENLSRQVEMLRARLDDAQAESRHMQRERDMARDQLSAMLANVGDAAVLLDRAVEAHRRGAAPQPGARGFPDLLRDAEHDGGARRTVERYAEGAEEPGAELASPEPPPAAEEAVYREEEPEPGSMESLNAEMERLLAENTSVAHKPQASVSFSR